jgi:hypothetical protein
MSAATLVTRQLRGFRMECSPPAQKKGPVGHFLKMKGEFRHRLRTVKSLPRMMHGKSVSHVDVSIRSHHVIRWCFVTRDICSFPGRASVVLRVRGKKNEDLCINY